ncbi:hypothetical protein [Nostoc sp.]|uniref:hypothetical protein n=1 Tax=Nostoc sp. TaxID=1180 RepID=UPI002FF4D8FB
MAKSLEILGILPKIPDPVLVIFQIVEVRDRQKDTNTSLAIVKKIVEVPGGRLLQIHK